MTNNDSPDYRAECTLAVIGIKPLLSRKIGKITGEQRRAIFNHAKDIQRAAIATVRGDMRCTWPLPDKHSTIMKALSSPENADHTAEMISALPPEIQSAFKSVADRALEALHQVLPANSVSTLAGPTILPIDDPAMFKFHSIYRVVNDPMQVFELISAGAILKSQVAAVKHVYPITFDSITGALVDAIIDARSKDESFQLDPSCEQGAAVWMGQPIVTAPFQGLYVQQDQTQNRKPDPTQRILSPMAEISLTQAQGVEFPKA